MLQPSNELNNIKIKYEFWRILNIVNAISNFRKALKNIIFYVYYLRLTRDASITQLKRNVPNQIPSYMNANLCGAPFDDPTI
jgi:hypothetical protein